MAGHCSVFMEPHQDTSDLHLKNSTTRQASSVHLQLAAPVRKGIPVPSRGRSDTACLHLATRRFHQATLFIPPSGPASRSIEARHSTTTAHQERLATRTPTQCPFAAGCASEEKKKSCTIARMVGHCQDARLLQPPILLVPQILDFRTQPSSTLQVLGPQPQDDSLLRRPTTPDRPSTASDFDPPSCRSSKARPVKNWIGTFRDYR
jgi:hypothetical protein